MESVRLTHNNLCTQNPLHTVVGRGSDDNATAFINEIKLRELKKLHSQAYLFPYRMNSSEEDILINLLGSRVGHYVNKPSHNTHAIPANLQAIAYYECIKTANDIVGPKGVAIDIGGSVWRTPEHHHCCTKITNSREDARYTQAKCVSVNKVLDGLNTSMRQTLCIHGAENCKVRSKYAYMINVYDAGMKTIAAIFDAHSLMVLDCWMFLPEVLIEKSCTKYQTFYKCGRFYQDPDEDRIHFAFKDQTNIYRHNKQIWRSYYTTTMIKGVQGGAINIEHIDNIGEFTRIRFTRTIQIGAQEVRMIPIGSRYSEMVIFPAITKLMQKGWLTVSKSDVEKSAINKFDKCKVDLFTNMLGLNSINSSIYPYYYLIPVHFASKIANYGDALLKEAFKYESVKQYLRTHLGVVHYEQDGNMVMVAEAVNIPMNVLNTLSIDIFMYIVIQRNRRTKTISESMSSINGYNGFWRTVWRELTGLHKWFADKEEFCNIGENQILTSKLFDLRPIYYTDLFFSNVVEVDLVRRIVDPIHALPQLAISNVVPLDKGDKEDKAPSDKKQTIKRATKNVRFAENDEEGREDLENIFRYLYVIDADSQAEIRETTKNCNAFIHDVSADGACGLHTLRLLKITDFSCIDKKVLDAGWLDQETMLAIAHHNACNVIMHINSKPVSKHMIVGATGTVCINFVDHLADTFGKKETRGHWQAIIGCGCTIHDSIMCTQHDTYVGMYSGLPIENKYLYVNCANSMLTDGAGQAKDFRNMFPNYDRICKIKTPLSLPVHFAVYNGIHICLAVAVDMGKYSFAQAIQAQIDIATSIQAYATEHKLTVLLPCIGTDIFKNPLCCHMRHFNNILHCRTIRTHLKTQKVYDYLQEPACRHGGYSVIAANVREYKMTKEVVTENFNKLIKNEPDMPKKIQDIVLYAKDKLNADDSKFGDFVFELSCAPGHFMRAYDRMVGAWYNGPDAHGGPTMPDKKFNGRILFAYANIEEFITFFDTKFVPAKCRPPVWLLDIPSHAANYLEFIQVIHERAVQYGARLLVIKTTEADMTIAFKGYYCELILNEGSKNATSELFFAVHLDRPIDVDMEHADITMAEALTIKDNILLAKQEVIRKNKNVCKKCAFDMDFNMVVNAKVVSNDVAILLTKLESDPAISMETNEKLKRIVVPEEMEIIMKGVAGVGGAGKTTKLIKTTCRNCTMVITPYRDNKEDINSNGHSLAQTYVSVLNRLIDGEIIKNIVIDEVFVHDMTMVALYKLLAPESNFVCTGDPYQIRAVDWNNHLSKCNYKMLAPYHTTTYRNPPSVVELLKKFIPGIKTNKKNGLPVIYADTEDIFKANTTNLGTKFLAFTHAGVNLIVDGFNKLNKTPDVGTVTSAHGRTIPYVHLYLADLKGMPKAEAAAYIYTAVSRASTQLILYGKASDYEMITTLLGTPMERALDNYITPIHDATIITKQPVITTLVGDDEMRLTPPAVDIHQVTDTLQKLYTFVNDLPDEVVDVKLNYLPEVKTQMKFTTDIESIYNDEYIQVEGKRLQSLSFNRLYASSDRLKSLQTMVARYSNKVRTKMLTEDFVDKFEQGFYGWLKDDWKDIAKCRLPDPTAIWTATIENIKVLQTKFPKEFNKAYNNIDESIFEDFEYEYDPKFNWTQYKNAYDLSLDAGSDVKLLESMRNDLRRGRNLIISRYLEAMTSDQTQQSKYQDLEIEYEEAYHMTVSFFMKKQPKQIDKPGFDGVNKAGQGVSAWDKLTNVIMSGHVRYFDDTFPLLCKTNVDLSYNRSDLDISAFFVKYSDETNDRSIIKLTCDFTEFDSTQEARGIQALTNIYKNVGMSSYVANHMQRMRTKWTLSMRGKGADLPTRLDGQFMQHSGQIHTLGSNTMYNMAAMGMCFKMEYCCAAFKGDDSCIYLYKYKDRTFMGEKLSTLSGFKFKLETPEIPEYICNVISQYGFIPDLLRRVTRVVSKIYSDRIEWDIMRRSMADCLKVLAHRDVGPAMYVLSQFYRQKGMCITPRELENIYFFLTAIARDPEYIKPTFAISTFITKDPAKGNVQALVTKEKSS